MPLPKPNKNELKKSFLDRCMGDSIMNKEYPDNDRRYAVCNSLWKNKKSKEHDEMEKIERRFLLIRDDEIRLKKEDGEPTKIIGYFAKFGKKSDNLGGFREIIEKGFFEDALKESDTVDLFNHDTNFILGRVSAGTLKIQEDDIGLKYECTVPDTQLIKDLVLSPIERGDIKGNSFGFRIKGNGDMWEEDEDGIVIRTLLKGGCKELIDGSQVVHPAYPDTAVALRSLDDWKEEKIEKEEKAKKLAKEKEEKEAKAAEEEQKRKEQEELEQKEIQTKLKIKEMKLNNLEKGI